MSCQEDSIPLHSTSSLCPGPLSAPLPLCSLSLGGRKGHEGSIYGLGFDSPLFLRRWLVTCLCSDGCPLQTEAPLAKACSRLSPPEENCCVVEILCAPLDCYPQPYFAHLHLLCIGAEKTCFQAGFAWLQRLQLSSPTAPTGQMLSIIMGLNDQLCH